MFRTVNSARNWKVSLSCNFSTRRVTFRILNRCRTSMEPPSKT